MEKDIIIREAVENDVLAMVELWRELMDFHRERYSLFTRAEGAHLKWIDFVTGHIKSDNSCVLVAVYDGQIAGYCLGLISKYPPVLEIQDYGELMDCAVENRYRRMGIGQKLFKRLYTWYRDKGIGRIDVRVLINNEISTVFWRKMGFVPYLETLSIEV